MLEDKLRVHVIAGVGLVRVDILETVLVELTRGEHLFCALLLDDLSGWGRLLRCFGHLLELPLDAVVGVVEGPLFFVWGAEQRHRLCCGSRSSCCAHV